MSNSSRVNKHYNINLNDNLVKAIRTHARLILIPFFQVISISITENERREGKPILTTHAVHIHLK